MTTDAYRNAYDAALADLTEISALFEELRTRKNQVENLIVALQSVFASDDVRVEAPSAAATPAVSQQSSAPGAEPAPEAAAPADYSFMEVPSPLLATDGDPFQRRIRTSFRFKGLSAQRSY